MRTAKPKGYWAKYNRLRRQRTLGCPKCLDAEALLESERDSVYMIHPCCKLCGILFGEHHLEQGDDLCSSCGKVPTKHRVADDEDIVWSYALR
jgi:hypothetical protein